MASRAWRKSSGDGVGGGDELRSGLDLDGLASASGPDELADGPAGSVLDPVADCERGEDDGRDGRM
jgi:hypothetical protein